MSTRTPVRRQDTSMALLNSLVEHAVDDDYAVAARKAARKAARRQATLSAGVEAAASPQTPAPVSVTTIEPAIRSRLSVRPAKRREGRRVRRRRKRATLRALPGTDVAALPDLATSVVETEWRRHGRGGFWLLVGVLATGFVMASAVNGVRSSRDAVSAERAGLVEQVRQSSEAASALESRLAGLQRDLSVLGAQNLPGLGAQAEAQVARLGASVGAFAVSGPGIVLRMEDAAEGEASATTGRVLDIDVQRVINGVWAAGASAISIGGQRITPLTAIRSANDVVLVNYRPLPPPYEITALGDPEELRRDILEGSAGEWLEAIAVSDGIRYAIRTADELQVPAAAELSLRYAEPVTP